ncbi:ABC transporter ATP-binding protein [Pelagibacterium xiamenense]|uniref:ABC transporter ATP-binding protein n=1 Tax=Pelagibacterium xiamenense TaxID=2901140 RepID=UPI001E2D66CE|nr:sn-glycerol-3-phosphate ABC transporter ATP-binding protein UgpC [Pelagibacterium xiamenense]MCD7058936.1 sn-glycerol-3-phosphate ABC transporter ATP-binding protein UgpC [Pelagibacterium xiamenense]
MSQITLNGVFKRYGQVPVLNDISLEIGEGEFIVLVGPSGCGKSTLLRMIAGLEDITAGAVAIGGKVVNAMPAKQRDLAMVFQSYALYPHMKVADNMSFALKLSGQPKAEIEKRVKEAATILGLENLLERLPRELSGGQRQRVAMGRAIVRNPTAFLFDEPLSNLDAKLRVKMRGEIKKLHQRLGKTMIYVTHDQTEAMTLADRIVVLNDGEIAQLGTPMEVYGNPANTFVAGFIGSPEINLLPATVLGSGAAEVKLADGTRVPLGAPAGLVEGTRVTYGIRPQHFALDETGMPAEIVLVEPTGEDQELMIRLGTQEVSMVVHNHAPFAPGDRIAVRPEADKAVLFDAGTGARLH